MISATGIWGKEEAVASNFPHSELLCFRLLFMLFNRHKLLIDFGCGDAWYLDIFRQAGSYALMGFDGQNFRGHPLVIVRDLSEPIKTSVVGQVLSLEVGEHIPQQFEQTFIDNLCNHCSSRMVISWAIPGQEGIGHVNCRSNNYIIDQIQARGFKFNPELTHYARTDIEPGVSYFKFSLMVFDKLNTENNAVIY